MPIRNELQKPEAEIAAGMLKLTHLTVIPEGAIVDNRPVMQFKFCFTSGPFLLPQNSGSLDWVLLNNDTRQQQVRVTVFKCGLGSAKTPVPPGPLVVTLNAGESTHNANEYTEGFIYEVRVECNSQLIFPYVSIWPANFGVVIPGTGITAGEFRQFMPATKTGELQQEELLAVSAR